MIIFGAILGLALLAFGLWKWPRITSVSVLAFVATFSSFSALLKLLPGDFSSNGLWMSFAFPLIWVGLQFWCFWDPKPRRVVTGLLLLSITGAAVVFLTPPLA